jgi:hypothetical protein
MFRFQARRLTTQTVVTKATSVLNPFIHYARVSGSFLKQVAQHSKLTFPDVGKGTQGITGFVNALTSGQWREVTVKQAVEFLTEGVKIGGFFLVGEMIGRGSVIGYQIEGTSHDSHH